MVIRLYRSHTELRTPNSELKIQNSELRILNVELRTLHRTKNTYLYRLG